MIFLSTPSARRATSAPARRDIIRADFYPRPPRGGRLHWRFFQNLACIFLSTPSARRATGAAIAQFVHVLISIHALREEGDSPAPLPDSTSLYFYPRPPRGGRRPGLTCDTDTVGISIHALREEGDQRSGACWPVLADFYPRPPRGGRLGSADAESGTENFYPRPPRGGRRADNIKGRRGRWNFYPRPPRGGRPQQTAILITVLVISIHALREEGDPTTSYMFSCLQVISIHALREEGDPPHHSFCPQERISIHALREEGDGFTL